VAATASIVIEVQEGQATAALQRLNAQVAQTGATLQPIQRISEQTFNNIEGGALKARESAALLGEEFGVKVPRALRGVIAESSLLGPIFTAAFSGLAVLGFIEILKQAFEQLTGFNEALKETEKQNAAVISSVAAANKILQGPQNLEQIKSQIKGAEDSVRRLNEQLGLTGDYFGDSVKSGLAKKFSAAGGRLVDDLAKVKESLNALNVEQAKLLDEELRTEPIEILKLQNAARLEGVQGIAKINQEERGETAVIRAEMNARITTHRVGNAEINEIHAKASAQRVAYIRSENDATRHLAQEALLTYVKGAAEISERERNAVDEQKVLLDRKLIQEETYLERVRSINIIAENQLKELRRQAAEETMRVQEEAAVAVLPPWQRSYAQIAIDTQRRLREIQKALDETRITGEEAAKQIAAVWQVNFAKMRDQLAGDLENLFDNITSGNIGKYFLTQFKHLVFQMVAAWILGMQQMKGASQQQLGTGGGILGSIFGGIFGGGGFGGGASGGPGGTPTFAGGLLGPGGNGDFGGETSGGGGAFGSIGLSAGGGAGAGTTLPSGAGPGGAIGGPLGGILGKIFSHNAGPISGSMLATLGIGLLSLSVGKGGVLGALGGAAGGALLGFSIRGPIGALIGGIAGLIGGLLHSSTKKARLEIEANIKSQAASIEDGYNLFQIDWVSSRSQLETLRQQGVDALKQAGVKDIDRSRVGHVDQWIDKAEKEIDVTQAERNRRAAIAFGPAQFRMGGLVGAAAGGGIPDWFAGTAMHFADGGAVPAILHEGEYVMRPEAVSWLGRGNLDRMNSGGGGGVVININTLDKRSFEDYMRAGGTDVVLKELVRAQNEGMW